MPGIDKSIAMNLNVDVNQLIDQIADAINSSADRSAAVHNACYKAFYGFGQKLNVMVCNLQQSHDPYFERVAMYDSVQICGITFGIWAFVTGKFVLHGDGTYENWCFMGSFDRSGPSNKTVTFHKMYEDPAPVHSSHGFVRFPPGSYVWTSFHGTHMRGYPDGRVDLTPNNDAWERWSPVWLGGEFYSWRSAHGKFLRAYPDGRVDLADTPREWERWEYSRGHQGNIWRSWHGTYLRANPDGRIDLAHEPREWEMWN